MTPETFEAEFVAYNEFRRLTGNPPVTRADFARTIANHNRTIAKKQGPSILEYMDEARDLTLEEWRKLLENGWSTFAKAEA